MVCKAAFIQSHPAAIYIRLILSIGSFYSEHATMPVLPQLEGSTFDADLRDRHIIHDYAAHDANGNPEKWRYEFWIFNEDRVVYAIHGGPMAGRKNFQAATYQCVRPGELWQIN